MIMTITTMEAKVLPDFTGEGKEGLSSEQRHLGKTILQVTSQESQNHLWLSSCSDENKIEELRQMEFHSLVQENQLVEHRKWP